MTRVTLLAALAIVAAALTSGNARAATLLFEAFLDGLQEVPPNAWPGTGDGTLSLDDVTGDYTINGTFADLIGTTTLAHIHGPAPPGVGAGVVHGLTIDLGVTDGDYSGGATFTAPQMADLIAGLYYVNIHTTTEPGGEIRGQLTLVPEPGTLVLLALGGLVAGALGWRHRRKT